MWKSIKSGNPFFLSGEGDKGELLTHMAPLVRLNDPDEFAKRFDNFMYGLMLASIERLPSLPNAQKQLSGIALLLLRKSSIPQIKEQLPLIQEIGVSDAQTQTDLLHFEKIRKGLRELIKFLDDIVEGKEPILTRLTDPITDQQEGVQLGGSLQTLKAIGTKSTAT